MSIEFYQTAMGRTFYDGTMPRIARALESIAKSLVGLAAASESKQSVPPNSLGDASSAAPKTLENITKI